MTARYLLDTNICIYLMKHQPPQVRERFAQCFVGDVVMSTVTLAELAYGVASSGTARRRNQAALQALLEEIPAVAFDATAAHAYRPLRAAHRARNRDALDKLIAAQALAMGVTLVTNNEADFQSFEGLRIENWVAGH
ncbi:MAG: type II toxin-antitoxin system VapC family toxin [Betaproteobacteria bacterium]|nr:type II toxin-antitoxin system VapC family toxin [Betaproteobacteria bacterium]